MMDKTLEELYNLKKQDVELTRVETKSGRWLELFENPKKPGQEVEEIDGHSWRYIPTDRYKVEIVFPEFTCRCPRTSQPDFAVITIEYSPSEWCVELKSLKYFLNSFRDEGHFHEQVVNLIYDDLEGVLKPISLYVKGRFNVRGGTYPTVRVGRRY